MISEHEAFQSLTDHLEKASEACKLIARFRPDTSRQWEKVGETLRVTREMAFRLAGEGTIGRAQ